MGRSSAFFLAATLATASAWAIIQNAWTTTSVDPMGYSLGARAIAVAPDRFVHVAYVAWNAATQLYELRYAKHDLRLAPSSWSITTIDANVSYPEPTTIAVDATFGVHIAYGDATTVKYAYGCP